MGGFGGFFFVPELHDASQWPFEAVVLLITKVPNQRETLWLSCFKGQTQPWTGESLQQPLQSTNFKRRGYSDCPCPESALSKDLGHGITRSKQPLPITTSGNLPFSFIWTIWTVEHYHIQRPRQKNNKLKNLCWICSGPDSDCLIRRADSLNAGLIP